MSYSIGHPTVIAIARNCCRCQQDFPGYGQERICQSCRSKTAKARLLAPISLSLSPRELQVAELVRQSHANKEIAYRLHLSEGTIKVYLSRIYAKLQLGNRVALAIWAQQQKPPEAFRC